MGVIADPETDEIIHPVVKADEAGVDYLVPVKA
jgi:hypothetical protein